MDCHVRNLVIQQT
uniref:Uncharacterized protein n=1 Tax=Pyxicephalus adspersus TaxID=30357 RepID=A0A499QP97_PYXAD|nr:hypothetical protein maker-92A13-exonerate_protein2genome-gene-0.14 [Pyxicephalus adspersus]